MLIAVAGMNHRSAPIEVRERVAFSPCAGRDFVRRLKEAGVVSEAVLISTCNRTELYAVVGRRGCQRPHTRWDLRRAKHRPRNPGRGDVLAYR